MLLNIILLCFFFTIKSFCQPLSLPYNLSPIQNDLLETKLIARANGYLDSIPIVIFDKSKEDFGVPSNNYFSFSRYWHLNKNGKVERKDGEISEVYYISDLNKLKRFQSAVEALGYAFSYSQEKAFGLKLIEYLNCWFIDENYRMNPNLDNSQAIPTINRGRHIGVIDFYSFPKTLEIIALNKIELIKLGFDYPIFENWVNYFSQWFQNSVFSQKLTKERNNIKSWFFFQKLYYQAFIGESLVDFISEFENLVVTQIDGTGHHLYEIERVNSFDYELFNLDAILNIYLLFQKNTNFVISEKSKLLMSKSINRLYFEAKTNYKFHKFLKVIYPYYLKGEIDKPELLIELDNFFIKDKDFYLNFIN